MTCTASTLRCPDACDYQRVLADCCREHVIDITRRVAEAFDKIGIVWWADYGTLLGAIRNPMTTAADYPWLPSADLPEGPIPPGIVPHDKDGDLGVLGEFWYPATRAVKQLASGQGYGLMINNRRHSMKVKRSPSNHTNVDIFFWYPRPAGKLYRFGYAGVDKFKGKEFPASMVAQRTVVPWEGLMLPAPADPEAFLEMRYGPGWRTPIPANNDGVVR